MSLTWVDGVAADTVPADDRGLNYADGAFETLSCYEGRIEHEDSSPESASPSPRGVRSAKRRRAERASF